MKAIILLLTVLFIPTNI